MSNQDVKKNVPVYFYYLTIAKEKDAKDNTTYGIDQIVESFSTMLQRILKKDLVSRRKDFKDLEKVVWLDQVQDLKNGNYNIVFKSAKYNHVRNEIDTETMEELGIGRPSTYTPIITVILARGYVARDGKVLKPTQLGEVITKIMNEHFPDIVDYSFTAVMENRLDTIENGKESLSEVLSDFYKGFAVELDNAQKNLNEANLELPQEETDIICESCGSKMVIKNGKFGKFAACPNFPTCKTTKTLNKDGTLVEAKKSEIADFKCEICGSDMVLRKGKFGDFYACSKYPSCKFTKTKMTNIGVSCPSCGADIVSRIGKGNKTFYSCSNYPKCNFSSWDMPTNERCPECSDILLAKKTGMLVCRNEKCGYKVKKSRK